MFRAFRAPRTSRIRRPAIPPVAPFFPPYQEAKPVLGSSDDRFREMFYEEARELLISLEEGLMELERRQGDRAHQRISPFGPETASAAAAGSTGRWRRAGRGR